MKADRLTLVGADFALIEASCLVVSLYLLGSSNHDPREEVGIEKTLIRGTYHITLIRKLWKEGDHGRVLPPKEKVGTLMWILEFP